MIKASALQVEIARSRLTATIGELTRLLYRSAYSTLMRESRDCSITVTSPRGELLVDDPDPFHGSSYHYLIERVLGKYGDSVAPGDVFITNHPYDAGVPHTPDLAVVVPSFVDGTLVGFCASLAHKSDVGGSVPGSASMAANHLYQEGLLLPLMRVATAAAPEIDSAVNDIIAANVRTPEIFFGDTRAQLGVTRVGAQRLADLAVRMGVEVMDSAFEQMLEQGAETLRRAVGSWADGRVSVSGYLDHDGLNVDRPVKLAVTVEKAGESLTFDFTESDDQADGPVNMTPMYADSAAFYAAICAAIPDFGFNDGIRRVVTIKQRPGSVLHPRPPAPVGAATMARYRLTDVCFEALSALAPNMRVAHAGSCGSVGFEWRVPGADRLFQYEVLGSAMGALADADGVSGVTTYQTNLSITPIEVLESKYPVRITRFELIADSGGAGEHRGGLSYRREYEALSPALVTRKAEKGRFPALGADGGRPGRLAAMSITRGKGATEQVPVGGRYTLEPGDRLTIEGPGGGGYGDPRLRPSADVLADVRAGRVTREAAELYGVVVTPQLQVDLAAIDAARKRVPEILAQDSESG